MDCNEISCLTLTTKEIVIDVEGTSLWVDLAKIYKNNEDLYINITPILKKFKGKLSEARHFLDLEQTKEYMKALEEILLTRKESSVLKHGLVYKKAGRYGGTWLHKDLFLCFARWVSPRFAVVCDLIVKRLISQIDELKEGREELRKLQCPLNDVIKAKLVDTGLKNDSAYIQFAVMIKRLIGCPDERDAYTKKQLDTAKLIIEEYRAMIVHGGKTSLKEMNLYLKDTPLNLAWQKAMPETV